MWLAYVDQLEAVVQVEYNASGTTILKVLFVLLKTLVEDKDGTAVASEKSTSSSAVHPEKVCAQGWNPDDDEYLVRYTRFNAVHPWKVYQKAFCATIAIVVSEDKSTSTREVHPLKALYNTWLAVMEVNPDKSTFVRFVAF